MVQAGWILTNIAAGTSENTKVVIDHGAVLILVKLLSSPNDDVREQAIWALGNVAGDFPRYRDLVLSYGALIPLLSQFNERTKSSILRIATWALLNFCRGKPQPPFEQVRPALPALARQHPSSDCGQYMWQTGGAPLEPISFFDDMQTQVVINHRSLPCLLRLLTDYHWNNIKKDACRTISNIAARNSEKIQAIIDAGLIAPMVNLYKNAEFDIKKEIVCALSNATCGATNEQIKYLASLDYIKALCDLLVCPDPRIVTAFLRGL
ncbi:importin subunit alpha-2 [Trifolium repens]|nr:importin subunit alpha-2 [Trifolium repens]